MRKFKPLFTSGKVMVALVAMTLPAAIAGAAGDATGTDSPSVTGDSPHNYPAGAHGGADPHEYLTAAQHLKVAMRHYAEGRAPLALDTLDKALARYPEDVELLGSKAGILLQQGRAGDALANLEQALNIAPDNVALLTNRAQAYRLFERLEEAYADLDRAIARDPDYLPARFNRGSMRLAGGDAAGAIADFERCIALDPHLPAPWFNRASAYHASGDVRAAIDDMKRFIEISANDGWNDTARSLLAEWGAMEIPASARLKDDS